METFEALVQPRLSEIRRKADEINGDIASPPSKRVRKEEIQSQHTFEDSCSNSTPTGGWLEDETQCSESEDTVEGPAKAMDILEESSFCEFQPGLSSVELNEKLDKVLVATCDLNKKFSRIEGLLVKLVGRLTGRCINNK